MPIQGLMSSATLASRQSENFRRKVFYQYPQSPAPLMGLMSLIEAMEEVPTNPFGWWEERYQLPHSNTAVAGNGAGPFTDSAGTGKTAGGWTATVGDSIRIYVDDASLFKVRDNVTVFAAPTTTSTAAVKGIVTAIETTSAEYLTVRVTKTVANLLNDATGLDLDALVTGTSSAEGARSKTGTYKFPISVSNFTQIFRTTVGPFTANAIKTPLRFDDTGHYKKTSKDALIDHMTRMEQACFWGERRETTVTNEDGDSVPERETGGVLHFLEQWELGNTGNGGLWDYRPSGADLTATAWNANDDKRVLRINGSVSEEDFMEDVVARAFFRTGNTGFEKIVFGGSGFMSAFNNYVRNASLVTTQLNSKEDTYGMELTKWKTIHGTLLFSTHPLFNENSFFKYNGFVLDLGSIGWHPFQDRDTELLKNRQANDYDGRKDEWLTEGGLELKFPERHLYIEGLNAITT